jgi:hypothetical protein
VVLLLAQPLEEITASLASGLSWGVSSLGEFFDWQFYLMVHLHLILLKESQLNRLLCPE